MSGRTLLKLLVVAVALSVYVFFFESTVAPWMKLGKYFPNLEPRDIYEIEISRPGLGKDEASGVDVRPILLRHEARGEKAPAWWIVEPLQARAFHPRVQGLCYLLADLERVVEVGEGEVPFPADGPALKIRFRTRTGAEHTVEVGQDYPDPDWDLCYVREGETLFATKQEFRRDSETSLNEIRSRAIFAVPRVDVLGLIVTAADGEPKHERAEKTLRRDGDSKRWRIAVEGNSVVGDGVVGDGVVGDGVVGDSELISELLDDLNAWKVVEFVTDEATTAAELAAFGLDKPRLRLRLQRRSGSDVVVEVGADVAKEETGVSPVQPPQVYVRHADAPFVYLADGHLMEPLLARVETFRSRYLFDFGEQRVQRVRAEFLSGARKGEGVEFHEVLVGTHDLTWQVRDLASGNTMSGDPELLGGLAADLLRLRVERFLDSDAAAQPETGLASPTAKVELWTLAGRHVEFLIGARSRDPVDEGLHVYHASRSGEPGGYLVLARIRGLLDEGVSAFRQRAFSALDPATVVEVEIHGRGANGLSRTWSVSRLGGREWVLSTRTPLGTGETLDSSLLDRLVSAFGRKTFRARRFLADAVDYPALDVELTRPALGISFTRRGGASEAEGFSKLVLGKRVREAEPLEYYARVNQDEVPVFTVTDDVRDLLERMVRHLERVTRD